MLPERSAAPAAYVISYGKKSKSDRERYNPLVFP